MAELNNLIDQARTSLLSLDAVLQKAKLLEGTSSGESESKREGIQRHFETLIKMVEMIPQNLKLEERLMQREEMGILLRQIDELRRKLEASLGKIESVVEENLRALNEAIEKSSFRNTIKPIEVKETAPSPSSCSKSKQLIDECRQLFEAHDYDACIRLLQEVLGQDPGNPEASCLLNEVQRKWEDQRLEEELVIHIDNLKKEAMEHFDKAQYEECVGMFRFLCELEPQNRTLRDYLELSQQKAQELNDGKTASEQSAAEKPFGGEKVALSPLTEQPLNSETKSESTLTRGEGASSDKQGELSAAKNLLSQLAPFAAKRPAPETVESVLNENSLPEEQELKEEYPLSGLNVRRLKMTAGLLVVVLVLIGLVLGLRSARHAQPTPTCSLDVQSAPTGAGITVNGEFKGISPLHLESLALGNYEVRIEKEGYRLNTQTVRLDNQTPVQVSVMLEPSNFPQPQEVNFQERASGFFEQGKWLEANQDCDAILVKDSQDGFALNLKEKIRRALLKQGNQFIQKGRWEEARQALNNVLVVAPRDPEALAALKIVKSKAKKTPAKTESKEDILRARIQEVREQLAAAVGSGNYFPPRPGNAMDLINQLNQLSPDDLVGKEKLDQIYRDLLTQMQRRLQARDFENAKALARQLQSYFAERSEFKNLRDAMRAEESKTLEAKSSSIQKAEAAMVAGRYVLPASDNVVLHCNHVLGLEPQNTRALSLKRESFTKATAQAKESVQTGKFEEARSIYLALLQISQSESSPLLNPKDLKGEADKMEFSTFSVLHNHTLGSCFGRLKMNGYVVVYIPNGDPKCAFTQKLSEVVQVEPGDKLKFQFKTKTYRFESNPAASKEDNRDKVNTMYHKLKQLMANGT
jgi:tetratricopeptide (TPR) repeat protein